MKDMRSLSTITRTLVVGVALGLAFAQCTESPPPTGGPGNIVDLASPTTTQDLSGAGSSDLSVPPADMAIVCSAGQRFDGNSCVCDISTCLCGSCSGTMCLPRTLASGQMAPRSIVLNNGAVYFGNSGGDSVQKVNTDGTGLAAVLTISSPLGLAVDSNNIYFSAPMGGTLYRFGRVDMMRHTMATGLSLPRAIAIDATAVYVVSNTGGTVTKVLIANDMAQTLASGQNSPYGLAVDGSGVYFTTGNGNVNRVGLDGTGFVTLASGQTDPRGIAVDAANVYWVNHNSGAAYAVQKAGGTPRRLGRTLFLESIAIDNTNAYVTSSSGSVLRFNKSATDGTPVLIASGQNSPFGITVDTQCAYWTNDGSGTVMKGDK